MPKNHQLIRRWHVPLKSSWPQNASGEYLSIPIRDSAGKMVLAIPLPPEGYIYAQKLELAREMVKRQNEYIRKLQRGEHHA